MLGVSSFPLSSSIGAVWESHGGLVPGAILNKRVSRRKLKGLTTGMSLCI